MALLRRYGAYLAIAAAFVYFLYTLSFPYQSEPSEVPHRHNQHGGSKQAPQQGSYKWAKIPLKHPVTSMIPLPTGSPLPLPKIQFDFGTEDKTAKNIREKRLTEVKKAFERCWRSYRERAWMQDELEPITGGSKNPFGGWAATLIDALDTLWIMDLQEEFHSAMKDVAAIDFGRTDSERVNVFETNIRHLGGLLAAYELSGEKILLQKAKEVGEMLYHAFDTPNRMPITRWDFHKAGAGKAQVADETVLVAEIGSLTMEFSRLSQLTNDPKWYDAISRIMEVFEKQQGKTRLPGMWPIVVNARKPDFTQDTGFTLAAMADSLYEYLPKTYALLGGLNPLYKKLYQGSMKTAIRHTLYRPMTPENADILMSGFVRAEGSEANLYPEMQHLVCFAGGMFALGGKIFENEEHVAIGRKLADGCVWAYKALPFGIMPEVSHLYACPNTTECDWDEQIWKDEVARRADLGTEKDPLQNIANLRLPKGFTAINDRRYILRPEAIESVFILYRITGQQQWQAAAWDMFTAIQQNTQTDLANAALIDVSVSDSSPPKMDSMESFWMAETLKYFYLIFSEPNVISLDDYVFNTEAHPLKIPK
ncbi:seven-hairpin glycosidase [Lindgomyces ingoldianus]|uniref:Seven-hairpin glycosidase n=1 Tax=Lindgomyces ingoldianus TaxID=673940 RepID=A0ACB6QHP1_9PLEO|nr:seven-hairpin glycosidase [Lindgomyces ingoldianus]KAF2466488.1 seven-hairpin glycosidase [Lindgomyces ingoldianus]